MISNSLNSLPRTSYFLRYFAQQYFGWEKLEFLYLKNICVNNEFIGIDFGANNGVYTKLMTRNAKFTYAIEPNFYKSEYLIKNNKKNKNFKLINKAISDRNGISNFFIPIISNSKVHGKGSILHENNFKNEVLEVETITFKYFLNYLKDYLENNNNFILKLDIEGSEKYVINNKTEFFKNENVCIMVEMADKNLKNNIEMFHYLISNNYKLIYPFEIQDMKIEEIENILKNKEIKSKNFIFTNIESLIY